MTTSGLERGGGIFNIWSPKPLRATLHRGSHPRKGIAWPCKEELLFSTPQSSFSWGTNKRQKRAENECGETEKTNMKKRYLGLSFGLAHSHASRVYYPLLTE